MKARFLIPLGLFLVMVVFLAIGLQLNPRTVPSPFIDKPAPAFAVPDLMDPAVTVTPAAMEGRVWLLNVWATWCPECWREHQYMVELARNEGVSIVGLNWKDEPDEARSMLRRLGNPFVMIADDQDGSAGIDWGVYGAPETFLIDKEGIIRYKHVGALTPEVWKEDLEPRVRDLE
ncbi:MAG: DsbE family thiol:disulfide interchange protein, partial [Chromatiales bacterium]